MTAPDRITLAQLEKLLMESPAAGKTPVSATEFKSIADELLVKLESVYEELDGLIPDNVLHSRWEYVLRSKRNVRAAIRTLEKSIKT